MTGRHFAAAGVAGLLVGGGIVAVLAQRKGAELQLRGQLLSHALADAGNNVAVALAAQGSSMEPRLAAYAQQAAEEHLGVDYGLTPARMSALQRLMARWGVS